MKIFTNKSIWKKIAIVLVIIILFQACATNPAFAKKESGGDVIEGGGKLIGPIFSLLVTMGDGILNVLHSSIMKIDASLIEVDNQASWWDTLKTIISVIVTAACIIGAIMLSGGVALLLGGIAAVEILGATLLGTNIMVNLGDSIGYSVMSMFDEEALPSTLYLPAYSYSPEEIFKGNILLFNVNFFREPIKIEAKKEAIKDGDQAGEEIIDYYYYKNEKGEEVVTSNQDSATILQGTVSSWYNAIRNICLVLMLSVLVYIGIRILLSTVASDKAKYRTMLKDWAVGLCLLFLMHYIMAFSVTLVEKLTNVVDSSLEDNKYIAVIPYTDEIEDSLEELGMEEDLRVDNNDKKQGYAWPSNLMGYLRLKAQLNTHGWQYIGEAIMFITLVGFTILFTFTYFKRLLHMTFLTIIAPLVALTYCIDKLNDGQAQGFNKWLKEYIFNLLIQPIHLLLYYILVTSTFQLMGENIIYSIVALGFMLPAEKVLRSLFGFEKAQTAPAIGPAGAMMASSVLSGLLRKPKSGGKDKGGSGDDSSDPGKPPRTEDSNPVDAFPDEGDDTEDTPRLEAGNEEPILDQYQAEGYDQNENGEYRNPYTGEYDPTYDPHNDLLYSQGEGNTEGGEQEDLPPVTRETIDNPEDDSEEEKDETPSRLSKIKTAGGRRLHATGAVITSMARKAPKAIGKKTIRMATGIGTGALAAGTAGAIAMMTGDGQNVAKSTAAAALGGYALGSGMPQKPHMKTEYKEAYDQAYNNKNYKEEAMNDYVSKYMKDPKNRTYFEEALGDKKEAKNMMKKGGEVEQYLRNGITDRKEMKALHKLQKEGVVKDTKQAIAVAQLGEMVGSDTRKMKQEDRDQWQARFEGMAQQSGVKNKKTFAEKRLAEIDTFNKYKNS